jgi:hypothetical protein
MKLLERCWQQFWQQSRLNKFVIVGALAAFVPFLLPTVVSWFRPTIVKVGLAFYTYERAYLVEGNRKTYVYETRNLVTECRLHRIEQRLGKGRARAPKPQSWVVVKLHLENVSDQSITNLHLGVRSPVMHPTTELFTSPNVEATGRLEPAATDDRRVFAISITAIAPLTSVVVSLKTPIDEKLRQFVYVDRHPVTIQVPFLSSDQFGSYPPKVSRMNARKILNRESVLRIGEETFANEKIAATLLEPDEPDLKDEAPSYSPLPKAKTCSDAEAGVW